MFKVVYEVVEHDGGWAYRVDTRAREAAERAAREQHLPGQTTGISYEDKEGHWHQEVSLGTDRPETDVTG